MTGTRLGGYEVREPLGQGGTASVYRAYQPALDRYVALKVLPPALAQDPSFHERFQREARLAASLRHPNILVVYDWGEQDGLCYLVSELVEGGTLADRLGEPLDAAGCLAILAPVASALDYAHGRGVVHRDVKPSNILLHADGTPVLGDFGLARLREGDAQLTASGMVLGTPSYMAPECARGGEVGPAADVYALAAVAYQALAGRLPFTADSHVGVLLAHQREQPPPLRRYNPELPAAAEAVVLRGLAKDPGARFPTAGAMLQALASAVGGRPLVLPGSPGTTDEATLPLPREEAVPGRPQLLRRLGYGAALGVLLAAGVALALHRSARPVQAPGILPAHGALLFQLDLSRPTGGVNVDAGDPQLDRVRFAGDAVEFDTAAPATGPAAAPWLMVSDSTLRDFVAELDVLPVSGKGLYAFGFRSGQDGQYAVGVTDAGYLALDALEGTPGAGQAAAPPQVLLAARPLPAAPAGQPTHLAVTAVGSDIAIYANGRLVGQERDGRFTSGYLTFDVVPLAGSRFALRLAGLRVYAAPASAQQ